MVFAIGRLASRKELHIVFVHLTKAFDAAPSEVWTSGETGDGYRFFPP